MTRDELVASVIAERKAQGLPPRITDPATLARIAAIVTAPERKAS